MSDRVDIDIVLDSGCKKNKVTIYAKEKDEQVNRIIEAIEDVVGNKYPSILGYIDDRMERISQKDILRGYIHGRKIYICTKDNTYTVNKTLSELEDILNPESFIRISQSEIINVYKATSFEFSKAGTVGIKMENGDMTWVARRRVKAIKEFLNKPNRQ